VLSWTVQGTALRRTKKSRGGGQERGTYQTKKGPKMRKGKKIHKHFKGVQDLSPPATGDLLIKRNHKRGSFQRVKRKDEKGRQQESQTRKEEL